MSLYEHSCYKYRIEQIEIEKFNSMFQCEPEYFIGYNYVILANDVDNYDIESDEWYETESEASIAAEKRIDLLESGEWS